MHLFFVKWPLLKAFPHSGPNVLYVNEIAYQFANIEESKLNIKMWILKVNISTFDILLYFLIKIRIFHLVPYMYYIV